MHAKIDQMRKNGEVKASEIGTSPPDLEALYEETLRDIQERAVVDKDRTFYPED